MIDDDPVFLERFTDFWKNKEECIIDTAKNTIEGLKLFNKNDYSVIVSDYRMPEMNGLDLLKKIRKKDKNTPFVLITGKGNEEIAKKALNLKVDRYINKQDEPEKQYKTIMDAIYEGPI